MASRENRGRAVVNRWVGESWHGVGGGAARGAGGCGRRARRIVGSRFAASRAGGRPEPGVVISVRAPDESRTLCGGREREGGKQLGRWSGIPGIAAVALWLTLPRDARPSGAGVR